VEFDPAVLEGIAKRFRREIWQAAPPDAAIESGIEMETFGPVLTTVFTEMSECVPDAAASVRHSLLRAGFEEAYCSRNRQRPGSLRSGLEQGAWQFPR
jgi:hypothetical protein